MGSIRYIRLKDTYPEPRCVRGAIVQKTVEKVDGIPYGLAVKRLRRRADDDANETDKREGDGHGEQLRPDSRTGVVRARRKVRCVPVL